jgi:UDP-N-acetyl-D-glucosamine/UDP-N-acetyl-D-galactosamine dehydrogenase
LVNDQHDAVVLAVGYAQSSAMCVAQIRALCKPGGVLFDVKYLFPAAPIDARL